MNVVLGAFQTQVAISVKAPSNRIEEYKAANEWLDNFKSRGGQERGDPYKAAQRIIQTMQQEKKPVHFTLGLWLCCPFDLTLKDPQERTPSASFDKCTRGVSKR
jgi:hypothetical protein